MRKNNLDPLISVIIPFFNHGKYIREALESIQNQTLQNIEIFIVDDCSTDQKSIETLKTLGVPILKTKENMGPAAARNIGARSAHGEFICFLDADDRIDRTFFEKALHFLQQKKDVSFAYSYIQHFDSNEEIHSTLNPYNFYELLWQNKLPYCAVIRRKDFEDVGGFDETLHKNESEDWDFWIRMGKKKYFGFCIPEPLFFYRKAENARLSNVRKNYAQVVKNIRYRHRDLFRIWNLPLLKWKWMDTPTSNPRDELTRAKLFHRSPQWIRNIVLKFYEAELFEFENWRTAPGKCLQMMVPISWRKKINKDFGNNLFHEKTKFSEVMGQRANREESNFLPEIHKQKNGNQKERVLIFLPWVPVGGVETLMLNVLKNLSSEFEFILMTTEKNENSMHSEFAKNAAVYHLPHFFSHKKDKVDFIFQKIRELEIKNIFIVNSLFAFKILPALKSEFPNISVSTSLHGWDKGFDFLSVAALYFSFLKRVVCVSESVKKKFEKKLGEKSEKIQLIRNTIDFGLLDLPQRENKDLECMKKKNVNQKNIVFVGRYNFDKNPHFFIDIANFFLTDLEITDFRFFLFGEGLEEYSLRKRAKSINRRAGKDIVFVGEKQKNVASIYAKADAFVNCSPREGFGISALESIYCGAPVVGFDLDVFQEILPEGYFFSISQKEESPLPFFAKQIFSATQKKLSPQEKENLKIWVEETFNEEKFFNEYKKIFSN